MPGLGVIAGNTVLSVPERLECQVLQNKYKSTYLRTYLPT